MARTADGVMRECRKVRRAMNARREGRLEEELGAIEREGMAYYRQIMSKGAGQGKPRSSMPESRSETC